MESLLKCELLLEGRSTFFLYLNDLAFLVNELPKLSRVEADARHTHVIFRFQTGLHLSNKIPFSNAETFLEVLICGIFPPVLQVLVIFTLII